MESAAGSWSVGVYVRAVVLLNAVMVVQVYAMVTHALCGTIAFWFPLVIAILIIVIWAFWLIYGITMKHE